MGDFQFSLSIKKLGDMDLPEMMRTRDICKELISTLEVTLDK
jgi:hypothetical protein